MCENQHTIYLQISISHIYLVSDALIWVNCNGTERGQDAGSNLCYTVEVVCGSKAKHTSRA